MLQGDNPLVEHQDSNCELREGKIKDQSRDGLTVLAEFSIVVGIAITDEFGGESDIEDTGLLILTRRRLAWICNDEESVKSSEEKGPANQCRRIIL